MRERTRWSNPYPLGAVREGNGIRFSFVSEESDAGILLYDAESGKRIGKVPVEEKDRIGNIYCKTVEGLEPNKTLYQLYRGKEVLPDERGKRFYGVKGFGKEQNLNAWKTGFPAEDYDWEEDFRPRIPFSEAIFYVMHVRGFTRHASSGVKNRGTFAGIAEKISYLRDIGVTTLELQPAYEFVEFGREEGLPLCGAPEKAAGQAQGEGKVNYWGYKKGFYYAPKSAYAAGEDATAEFKDLVKALHQNGMELVMQFYFPEEVNRGEIPDILRYWALEYHVDGFRLIGERLPAELIAGDELLADSKLLWDGFEERYRGAEPGRYPHLAEYNDGYLYDMRRFLKGDEGMLGSILRQMRHIPENMGRIHYLTNYYGFTLADLVAYDHKHNEENGEENKDGNSCNCSWNCGEEGVTRSRRIRRLREGQIRNALCLLMLTQSTPLLFMGDEFGNSQKGNNNPWCQDNPTAWLDWNAQKKNGELLAFWKELADFRKAHPILHPEKELRLTDYLSCGYPDLSYHGESAWSPRLDGPFRHVGLMLCGKYARIDRKREDDFLYIALNMHWLSHRLALPRLPKGMRWEKAIATAELLPEPEENVRELPPRSIAVFIGAREPEE
ncbi:MAG: alpha-amylase family glycosyl hydrolase [Roseburia sp.]|nr:alpha-amylase family glycosyl hydrolase [Roseburia sp.]MCM1097391.1 alpha-amylase family glycosyl hydrolase [Ruminococcus flavefaciens]